MKTALVILAAGLSSRMGVLKPLLPVGGETALARALRLGQAAGAEAALVVTGHAREKVEAELGRLAVPRARAVYNPRYEEGMLPPFRRPPRRSRRKLTRFSCSPSTAAPSHWRHSARCRQLTKP